MDDRGGRRVSGVGFALGWGAAISLAIGWPGGTGLAEAASAPKVVIRVGVEASPPNFTVTWPMRFKELVEAKAGGQVEVRVFHSGQLGTTRQIIEQVQLGTLEMAMPASDMPGLDARFGLMDLPFLFRDREHIYKVLDGPVGQELHEGLLKGKGVRVLGFAELGFRQITSNVRPIRTPADLKGIKIRVPPNKLRVATFKALGAAPTPMAFSELYTALQQGVVDGQENPLATVWTGSFFEVQRYASLVNYVYTPTYPMVNEKFWRSIPADLQASMLAVARDTTLWHRQEGEKADRELVEQLRKKGMQVNTVDPAAFIEPMKPVWREFGDKIGQKLIDQAAATR